MQTVAQPLTSQQLIDTVYQHVALIHNGIRTELLSPGASDGPIARRIAQLTGAQLARAMIRCGDLRFPNDLEVLRAIHAVSTSSEKARFAAEVGHTVHGILHRDHDQEDNPLCDLVMPTLIFTLLTDLLGLDPGDRVVPDEPQAGLYCRIRRAKTLSKLIARVWERATDLVDLAPELKSTESPRTTIKVSEWMLAPRLREGVDWLCREASRLTAIGRSERRAIELAVRRFRRRLQRRDPRDLRHPWGEWLDEHRQVWCDRQVHDHSGDRNPSQRAPRWPGPPPRRDATVRATTRRSISHR